MLRSPLLHCGRGGERSEAGKGFAVVTHKIDQFALHTAARRRRYRGRRVRQWFNYRARFRRKVAADTAKRQFADSISDCGSRGIYWTAEDRDAS
jgi:hypothetical protein